MYLHLWNPGNALFCCLFFQHLYYSKRLGENACPSTNSQISATWIKDLPKASTATSVNSQICAAMTIGLCAATAIINGGM